MKYKAVIFDLDGTLLNTIRDLSNSMNAALSKSGFPVHTVEEYKHFIGVGVRHLVWSALPESRRDDETVNKYVNAMREEYGVRWDEFTRPYNNIPRLLDELTGRNVKMAVLSNKMDDFTRLMISKLLPDWKFEVVFGERPNMPKKPDPTAALEIAETLGIPPQQFMLLGDSQWDMQTANSAGMLPVGALWGFGDADILTSGGAKHLIEDPLDLLDLL